MGIVISAVAWTLATIFMIGLNFSLTRSCLKREREEDASEEIEFDVSATIMTDASHDPAKYSQTFETFDSVKEINLQKLPLHEKVKHVIAENPILNIFGIQKVLKHEEFGSETISVFRLWLLLKELDLNNKTKRFRYYRSC